MSETRALLSVVIPTRNRFAYVGAAIRSVLGNPSPVLRLVVEDNSDDNQLEEWVARLAPDPRLQYRHMRVPVSMVENYDRAMSRVDSEYVCFIGDDDSVTAQVVAAADWARRNGYDAIVPQSVINYIWPDLNMAGKGMIQAGELRIYEFSGTMTEPDSEVEMVKCVRDAGQGFHKLPKAYYGIIRCSCLEQVRQATGSYFPGVSPDLAAALAIANHARRVCHVDYPLFVPGSSARSNAGLSGLNRHIGRLRDQPHLPPDCEEKWSRMVPRFYSVQTIWAEAAVGALAATGRQDLLRVFNTPKLVALCFLFHRQYLGWAEFRQVLQARKIWVVSGCIQTVWYVAEWWWLRCWRFLMRKLGRKGPSCVYSQTNIQDIAEAVQAVDRYLEKRGVRFKS